MAQEQPKLQTKRTFTQKTFTKAIAVRPFYNIYGVDTSKKRASQRIINEATALDFIRNNTTISVPRVLETGESADGTYLTVERAPGIQLDLVGAQCHRLPSRTYNPHDHQSEKCEACQNIANSVAAAFIKNTMLPQLAALRSEVSSLNGVVIPPPWVNEFDRRPEWKTKVSKHQDFVFSHGDLGPQNLLFDPAMMKISSVVDWENAGFEPTEYLDLWAVDTSSYYNIYRNKDLLARLIALLE